MTILALAIAIIIAQPAHIDHSEPLARGGHARVVARHAIGTAVVSQLPPVTG